MRIMDFHRSCFLVIILWGILPGIRSNVSQLYQSYKIIPKLQHIGLETRKSTWKPPVTFVWTSVQKKRLKDWNYYDLDKKELSRQPQEERPFTSKYDVTHASSSERLFSRLNLIFSRPGRMRRASICSSNETSNQTTESCQMTHNKSFSRRESPSSSWNETRLIIALLHVLNRSTEDFLMLCLPEQDQEHSCSNCSESGEDLGLPFLYEYEKSDQTSLLAFYKQILENICGRNTSNIQTDDGKRKREENNISLSLGQWIRVGAYIIIFLIGIVGNSLVVVTLVYHKKMRSVTNIFLLNLAISDLLLGVVCMPFTLVGSLLQNFIFGKTMCMFIPYIQAVSVSVSVWTLVAISLERFYAICQPFSSRQWQTHTHAYRVVGCVWCGSFLAMIPIAVLSELVAFKNAKGWEKHKCREKWPSVNSERAFSVLLSCFLLLIPVLIMALAYFKIVRHLSRGIKIEKKQVYAISKSATTQSSQSLSGLRHSTISPTSSLSQSVTHPTIISQEGYAETQSPHPMSLKFCKFRTKNVAECSCPVEAGGQANPGLSKLHELPSLTPLREMKTPAGREKYGKATLGKRREASYSNRSGETTEFTDGVDNGRKKERSEAELISPPKAKSQLNKFSNWKVRSQRFKSRSWSRFSRARKEETEVQEEIQLTSISSLVLQPIRSTHLKQSLVAKQRVIRMLFVLVAEFFICWTPLFLVNLIALWSPTVIYGVLGNVGISLIQLLAYASSCCNPITYCFMNATFLQSFKQTFGRRNSSRLWSRNFNSQGVYSSHIRHRDSQIGASSPVVQTLF